MRLAAQVKPDVENGNTAQGRYVGGPDGTAYAYNNNRSVERVLAMMDTGLAGYRAKPPAKVSFEGDQSYGARPPAGTTVVRVFARITPLPPACDDANQNVARDHMWISAAEASALNSRTVPASFANRLVRFHLVDNVRGEPDHWRPSEITKSDFQVKNGHLNGTYEMSTADGKRGLSGSFEAQLTFSSNGEIVGFRRYGEAIAWGRSTYTPNPPEGKFPIKFAFVLAQDEMSRVVSPQAVFYGNEYFRR